MPQLISSKKYCLFNIGFLILSLCLCLGVYLISTPPSIYPFIFVVLTSHFLFTLLSWWCLFKPSTDERSIDEQYSPKKNKADDNTNTASSTTLTTHNSDQPSKKQRSSSSAICTESRRILVVDDNTSNITVLENYLQADNRKIVTANNGLDAIRHVEKQTMDIIFMDIEMEGMNGPQTVQHIRALEKTNAKLHIARTPIIAVSAHKEKSKRLAVLQQDFDDYLEKPVSADTVHEVMQRWEGIERQSLKPAGSNNLLASRSSKNKMGQGNKKYPPTKTAKPTNSKKDVDKVINIEYSLSHSNNNNVLARDMLALLITMIQQEKATLLERYEQRQWEKLYQLNHKIYGGSSYCGVPKLQTSNQQLERLLQSHLTQYPSINNPSDKTKKITIEESAVSDIKQALDNVLQSIDDILLWNEQYDMDIIFNIEEPLLNLE
ncbi:response regulator [Eionea flava]